MNDEQLEANRFPELDSYWNYRVVRRAWEIDGEIEEQFGICEVYYTDGKPVMCSEIPDGVHGETLEDLKKDFEYHQLAFIKPTLNYEDIGNETTDAKTTT